MCDALLRSFNDNSEINAHADWIHATTYTLANHILRAERMEIQSNEMAELG